MKSGLALVALLTLVLFFYAAFFFKPPSVKKQAVENQIMKSEELSNFKEKEDKLEKKLNEPSESVKKQTNKIKKN